MKRNRGNIGVPENLSHVGASDLNFFLTILKEENIEKWQCNLCSTKYTKHGSQSSDRRSHLSNKHLSDVLLKFPVAKFETTHSVDSDGENERPTTKLKLLRQTQLKTKEDFSIKDQQQNLDYATAIKFALD